jgi:hypothetical protein
MNFRERYQWTWQYAWPMTAIELGWSGISYLAYGESWYAAAEAIHMVLAFFVIAPWACRRALALKYPTFQILTFGYGSTTPKRISYLESFKAAWLLGWRGGVLGILLLLTISLVFTQAKEIFGMVYSGRVSGGGASPWNALILAAIDFASNMILVPLLIPGMLKKKYHGFHLERADAEPVSAKTAQSPSRRGRSPSR